MARPPDSPHPTTLGNGTAFLFVLFPAFYVVSTTPYVLLSNLLSVNWAQHLLNFGLLAVLGVAYVVWRAAVLRRRLTPASGVGFVAAGYGLLLRVHCEFLLSLIGMAPRAIWPGSGFGDWIALVRLSGLVGFVFGLALVLAASLWERRVSRDAPAWVRPR